MKINYKKLLKVLFYTLLFFIVNIKLVYSEVIKKITISGNERLANETIVLFSELNINDSINSEDLNNAFRKLYDTDYFKDIKINFSNGILNIYVIENPLIQSININGVKNKTILEEISKITKKLEKYPYLENNINDQKNLLLNIVRNTGFYFAEIETKIQDNNNNSVNIIYNFNLGERAKINEIKFIGNKVFKNNKLRKIIISEESKPWKFITPNKYLNEQRIQLDVNLLKNYFKNKGYYNVLINSSSAKVIDKNNFVLTFNIKAGKKYYFNDINLNVSDDYEEESFSNFSKIFDKLKGKAYSLNSIKKIINEIDKTALQKEFIFINAQYQENIVDNNKIDIDIFFEETEKFFVDRINIFGNFITEEKVIRNVLIVDEGDAYNKILFNKSINDIKSKNIFKSVTSEVNDSDLKNNKKIINITVEEKATGEIFAGAGTGTSGSSISGGIKERNYLGKGIELDTNLTLSDDQIKGKFSVINPNFRNTDRSINTTIESTATDYMTSSGYKTTRTGVRLGTGFEQYDDLFFNIDLSTYYEKLETSSSASAIKKKQEGDYFENLISYSLTLNKLDQNFQPSDGHITKFSQTLPIYSDDLSLENSFTAAKYHSVNESLILSSKLYLKAVNSLDDDVRVSRRVYIPSSRLRGFESGSIGPKDGTQYVGGNYGTAVTFNTTLPQLFTANENIDFNLFLDAANLWHVDYDSSLDSNKIRSATGISVNWFTPVGPLSFSYAVPLSEAKTDKTEKFRFQIGTSF
tara:strand:+ start:319 stop:2577 length:2259 start_codon:yes stop_codon:yes gene_type:complete